MFTKLLHDAVAEKRPDARWLRGGFWRNFQVKYREINDLHKQMLRTSRKVAAMTEGPARPALDHLHRGQSNDCYWHGLFGGIYISHMRLATYEHLIAAEDAADRALGSHRVAETDLDMDGLPALLADPGQVVGQPPVERRGHRLVGRAGAWHALGAASAAGPRPTTRRPAHEAKGCRRRAVRRGRGTASIHDMVMVKEEGLLARLFYDDHERLRARPVPRADGETPAAAAHATTPSSATSATGRGASTTSSRPGVAVARGPALGQPLTVTKSVRLGGDRPHLTLVVEGRGPSPWRRADRDPVRARVVAPPARRRRQPVGLVRHRGERSAHDGTGEAASIERSATATTGSGSPSRRGRRRGGRGGRSRRLELRSGFERVYQGSGLLSWPLTLAPGESRRFGVAQS